MVDVTINVMINVMIEEAMLREIGEALMKEVDRAFLDWVMNTDSTSTSGAVSAGTFTGHATNWFKVGGDFPSDYPTVIDPEILPHLKHYIPR